MNESSKQNKVILDINDESLEPSHQREGKRKLEVVEDSSNIPAVGIHHGGNFQVYMTHKIQKLNELHQRPVEEILSAIFANCCVYVNGATNPPLQDIRRLVTINGGEFAAYKISRVTHIVCDYLTDAQLKQELGKTKIFANSNHKKTHFVRAKWITDSVQSRTKLPESDYLPKGLKGRFGNNLRDMLQSASSDSHPVSSHSSRRGTSASTSESVNGGNFHYRGQLPNLSSSSNPNGRYDNSSACVSTVTKSKLPPADEDVIVLLSPEDNFLETPSLSDKKVYPNNEEFIRLVAANEVIEESEKSWYKNLLPEQREFIDSVPPELRADILSQLMLHNKLGMHVSEDRRAVHDAAVDESAVVELLSRESSPTVTPGNLHSRSHQMKNKQNENSDEDIINLASSPDCMVLLAQESTENGDLMNQDAQLMESLQEVINFIHSNSVSSSHQRRNIEKWINSTLTHASFLSLPPLQDSSHLSKSGRGDYDEERMQIYLHRCWQLIELYTQWLIQKELLSYVKYLEVLFQEHPLCRWSEVEEEQGLWRKVFVAERCHRLEYLTWKSQTDKLCLQKFGSMIWN